MGMKGIGSAFIVGGALIASFLSPMNSPENSPIKGAYEDLGALGDQVIEVYEAVKDMKEEKEKNGDLIDNLNKDDDKNPDPPDLSDIKEKLDDYIKDEAEHLDLSDKELVDNNADLFNQHTKDS